MRDKTHFNRSILCVDDEEDVLESYRDVLSSDPQKDLFAEILAGMEEHGAETRADSKYNYWL